MERLREVALASIGKGCAFAALGIFCMMLGLSFDPLLMVQTGGALTLGLAAVLVSRRAYSGGATIGGRKHGCFCRHRIARRARSRAGWSTASSKMRASSSPA